jgi:hypothetical protein
MRMLGFGQPRRSQQQDPPVMTTCTHARCRNVRKPGTRLMSARSCPASTMDATIGQPSGHPMSGRIRPDTVHSTRQRQLNRKPRGQGNGRTARQAPGDILDHHDHLGHQGHPPARWDAQSWGCG